MEGAATELLSVQSVFRRSPESPPNPNANQNLDALQEDLARNPTVRLDFKNLNLKFKVWRSRTNTSISLDRFLF